VPPIDVTSLDAAAKIRAINAIARGQVLRLDLGGSAGKELRGPHYCVVISADKVNQNTDTLVVVATMTHGGRGPRAHEVPLKAGEAGLPTAAGVVAHHVRTIDPTVRVAEIFGTVEPLTMLEIENAIKLALDLK
jgi:mRNA-degrading endonuclease toxin of MazEF toxin-antitoxin module